MLANRKTIRLRLKATFQELFTSLQIPTGIELYRSSSVYQQLLIPRITSVYAGIWFNRRTVYTYEQFPNMEKRKPKNYKAFKAPHLVLLPRILCCIAASGNRILVCGATRSHVTAKGPRTTNPKCAFSALV